MTLQHGLFINFLFWFSLKLAVPTRICWGQKKESRWNVNSWPGCYLVNSRAVLSIALPAILPKHLQFRRSYNSLEYRWNMQSADWRDFFWLKGFGFHFEWMSAHGNTKTMKINLIDFASNNTFRDFRSIFLSLLNDTFHINNLFCIHTD